MTLCTHYIYRGHLRTLEFDGQAFSKQSCNYIEKKIFKPISTAYWLCRLQYFKSKDFKKSYNKVYALYEDMFVSLQSSLNKIMKDYSKADKYMKEVIERNILDDETYQGITIEIDAFLETIRSLYNNNLKIIDSSKENKICDDKICDEDFDAAMRELYKNTPYNPF